MVITRKIGSAMIQQIDRVNQSPERLLEIITELEETIRRKDNAIKMLQQQVEFMNDGNRDQINQSGYHEIKGKRFLDGVRVYTLQEAADLCVPKVSYWIAHRYVVKEKYWEAARHPLTNEWLVYASNTFTRRKRKNAKR